MALRDALSLIVEDIDDSGEVLRSSLNAARRVLNLVQEDPLQNSPTSTEEPQPFRLQRFVILND